MNNLFSISEIHELKKVIKLQKKDCLSNNELNEKTKNAKLQSLDNFNKILLKFERNLK